MRCGWRSFKKMTRYGLISDIHTNINSLLCAFTVLDNCAVDFLYHLGDIAGGMHNSNQTIEALIKKGVQGVMGNHDLAELCCHSEPLSPRTRDYLVNLPEKMEREDIVFTHGINRSCWLVKNNQGGVAIEKARNSQLLPLPGRRTDTTFKLLA